MYCIQVSCNVASNFISWIKICANSSCVSAILARRPESCLRGCLGNFRDGDHVDENVGHVGLDGARVRAILAHVRPLGQRQREPAEARVREVQRVRRHRQVQLVQLCACKQFTTKRIQFSWAQVSEEDEGALIAGDLVINKENTRTREHHPRRRVRLVHIDHAWIARTRVYVELLHQQSRTHSGCKTNLVIWW